MNNKELEEKYHELKGKYLELEKNIVKAIDDYFKSPKPSGVPYPEEIFAIKSRVKSLDSFLNKASRYKSPFEEINDILGITIVCYTENDCDRVLSHLG